MDKQRENQLLKIRDYAEEQFDKLLIYLSSGGLLLTIGFIENIIKIDESAYISLLITTWISFTGSLIIMLFSHRTSLRSMNLELSGIEEKSDFWDTITNSLNWIGLTLLVLGILSFIIFVLINL